MYKNLSEFTLIKNYITENSTVNTGDYFKKFISSNVIVNAFSNHISFTKKKSGLSVKCAFNGSETYETNSGRFRIDDSSYLVLNREQEYSGYIDSLSVVESFSIFFEKKMVDNIHHSLLAENFEDILDYVETGGDIQPVLFIEKTYNHDDIISPALFRVRNYIRRNFTEKLYLEEQFHLILDLLFSVHKKVIGDIKNFPAIKPATKIELYKRLNIARDYIDSSFSSGLDLGKISGIACLSSHHFLRLFKKYFRVTPHQYITCRRLEHSAGLMKTTGFHITEICRMVGYENLSTFSRLFKQHYLVSPEMYRTSNSSKKSISVK